MLGSNCYSCCGLRAWKIPGGELIADYVGDGKVEWVICHSHDFREFATDRKEVSRYWHLVVNQSTGNLSTK
jgi:hypothetical protein